MNKTFHSEYYISFNITRDIFLLSLGPVGQQFRPHLTAAFEVSFFVLFFTMFVAVKYIFLCKLMHPGRAWHIFLDICSQYRNAFFSWSPQSFSATYGSLRHFPTHDQGSTESRKTLEQKLIFKSVHSILTVSMNAFHSTNLFRCFSRYHATTNSVAQSFCISTTHNPQFLDSLRRRANARNVSFRISLRGWQIHIINPVDKTKLPLSPGFV